MEENTTAQQSYVTGVTDHSDHQDDENPTRMHSHVMSVWRKIHKRNFLPVFLPKVGPLLTGSNVVELRVRVSDIWKTFEAGFFTAKHLFVFSPWVKRNVYRPRRHKKILRASLS